MKEFITLLLCITSLSAKDLIIVIGGAQESHRTVKCLAKNLNDTSFDAVAVKFHSRLGIETSIQKLTSTIEKIDLSNYDDVHFYAFTLGGVVLKETLKYLTFTPKRIVFIESPIENNLSAIAQKTVPLWIMKIGMGRAVVELPAYKNRTLPDSVESGLFITIGVNELAMKIRKRAFEKYPDIPLYKEPLAPDYYGEGFHDYFYSTIDHTELYEHPELYKDILLRFFRTGTFGASVDRTLHDETFPFFPDIL